MEGMNFAAIDIGTNAARLLIKNIDHNPLGETKFRKVLFIRYPLRLGMDVFSKGKIGKERAEMMMRMIKGFKQMMRMYDVVDYRACATSAMRDAKNGKALIKKIEKKTGIRIDLIEGKEEAGILYGNHIEKLPNKEGTFMYVDVGGGSTEITLIHQGRLVGSMSYNIGTIRLLNRAVKDGIVDGLKADMAGMRQQSWQEVRQTTIWWKIRRWRPWIWKALRQMREQGFLIQRQICRKQAWMKQM